MGTTQMTGKVRPLRMAAFLLAAALPMVRAAAPSAVSLPPQSVLSDRADLKATVAANGALTRANFQWGKTTNYELTVTTNGFDLATNWNGDLTLQLLSL